MPPSIVSFFHIDCKSSVRLLLPSSVDSVKAMLPLPSSQDSTCFQFSVATLDQKSQDGILVGHLLYCIADLVAK